MYETFSSIQMEMMDIPNVFNTRQYTFDKSFSMLELIGNALRRLNENISHINSMSKAIEDFQKYVEEQINNFQTDIQNEINDKILEIVNNGTLENLINTTIFNQINADLSTLKNDVSELKYKTGGVVLSLNPSNTIYNKGETVNGVMLNINIVEGFIKPTTIKVYKNNVLVYTKNAPLNLIENYYDGNLINSDTEYFVELLDGKKTVKSNTFKLNFINNILYGVSTGVLTSLKILKDNIHTIFDCDNSKILFKYPSNYGELQSIIFNNVNVLESFIKSTETINNEQYFVYTSINLLYGSFDIYFNFDTNNIIYSSPQNIIDGGTF